MEIQLASFETTGFVALIGHMIVKKKKPARRRD
jgi:hypothetical protein